jgi:hypothetical protein
MPREDDLRRGERGDPNEGRDAPQNIAADLLGPDDPSHPASANQREAARRVREITWVPQTFTSCWHMSGKESEDMHRRYIGDDNGVAIFSTVGQLRSLCNGASGNKEAIIAPIRYVDWLTEKMHEHGDYYTMLYKDRERYEYENELRFMIRYIIGAVDGRDAFWGESWPDAERIALPLQTFVTRVRIAPQSRPGYEKTVNDLLASYKFYIPVEWSELGVLARTDE